MQVSAAGRRTVDGVFVGRHAELARLEALLGARGPRALFVHGLAGSGKSTLVQQFGVRAEHSGTLVLALDCRAVEPTEQGFFAALGAAGGLPDSFAEGVGPGRVGRLAGLAERVVLCLDQYEVLRLLDTWVRQILVPSLPGNVRLVLAGREPPHAAWARLPAGAFEALLLGPLTRQESAELLGSVGVGAAEVPSITRFAGGHPLTLLLAALAVKEQPALPVQDVTLGRLIDEFALAYLDDLDDQTRNLLEAAAVVRRVTRSLIASMLPDVDAGKAFNSLRALPFVDVTADGLALHESLQQAIAAQLRAADPSWHRTLRQRAWTHLRAELRHASRPELWRYTADMIYLLENPEVREAHFPSGGHHYALEPATSADAAAIDAIIVLHEPPTAADLLRRWWTRCPEAFRVARDQQGQVAGFIIMTTSGRHDPLRFADDPVVEGWLQHLRREPIPASQELLLIRRWLTREAGDGPCGAQAACWRDLKRAYMELRPRLRRNYATTNLPEVYAPVLAPLSGGPIPNGAVEIDGRAYHGLVLDFGPSSVDGWLTRIAAAELGLPEDDLLDVRQRQLLVDGQRIDLTSLEFEVLHYLRQHEGATVPRYALLTDVWGYQADIGSNVVEAVVHALRKKLGARAAMIETVRGVGYRLR
jgi:AAA ATPase domain